MSWELRRLVQFGHGPEGMVQRSDGSWKTDFVLRVLDHEAMPGTAEELLAFIRKDVDPDSSLKATADEAVAAVALLDATASVLEPADADATPKPDEPGDVKVEDTLRQATLVVQAIMKRDDKSAAAWREKRNVSTNQQDEKHPDLVEQERFLNADAVVVETGPDDVSV